MARFVGSLQDLKAFIAPLDFHGIWLERPNHVWIFRCRDGGGLLWSQTRGTLWFDGPQAAKARLEMAVVATLTAHGKLVGVKQILQPHAPPPAPAQYRLPF